MKGLMKKTLAIVFTALFVFGIIAINGRTVIAKAESEVNHYEYSYDYLKYCLKTYGDKQTDEDGYHSYYFTKPKYTTSNSNAYSFSHFFGIAYHEKIDTLEFFYICDDLDLNAKFFYASLSLPFNESSSFSYNASYYSKEERWNASVYPRTYQKGDELSYTVYNNGGLIQSSATNTTFNNAFSWAVVDWNEILVAETGMTLGNFKFTNLYSENTSIYPKLYTVKFDANGHGTAPASKNVSGGNLLSNPGNLSASGYTFTGWYKEPGCINKWNFENDLVTKDMTLYAGWSLNTTPSVKPIITVKEDAKVPYRATVTVTASATGIPDGYFLAIYEGQDLRSTGTKTTVSYNAGEMTSGKSFTVKIINTNEVSLKDSQGTEVSKGIRVAVKNSFFDILIAFFQGLFGALPKVTV